MVKNALDLDSAILSGLLIHGMINLTVVAGAQPGTEREVWLPTGEMRMRLVVGHHRDAGFGPPRGGHNQLKFAAAQYAPPPLHRALLHGRQHAPPPPLPCFSPVVITPQECTGGYLTRSAMRHPAPQATLKILLRSWRLYEKWTQLRIQLSLSWKKNRSKSGHGKGSNLGLRAKTDSLDKLVS